MSETAKIMGTLVSVAVCALISGALFPPGDVPRQVFVVAVWFVAGFGVAHIWA